MKKSVKYTLSVISGIVATLALILLVTNYVFTTKLSLSCSGKETLSIFMGVKVTAIETKDKLEGVTLTITKYPFRNHQLTIDSTNIQINSQQEGAITGVLDNVITGGKRFTTKNWETYNSITFNRLTRGIEIENISKNVDNGSGLITKFEGICTEVKAL